MQKETRPEGEERKKWVYSRGRGEMGSLKRRKERKRRTWAKARRRICDAWRWRRRRTEVVARDARARSALWRHDVSTAFATRADVTITVRVRLGAREQHARDHAVAAWPGCADWPAVDEPLVEIGRARASCVITHPRRGRGSVRVPRASADLRKLHCAARRPSVTYCEDLVVTVLPKRARRLLRAFLLFFPTFRAVCPDCFFPPFSRLILVRFLALFSWTWTRTRSLSRHQPRPSWST